MTSILVTGGCGFIASTFLNYMSRKYPQCIFVNLDKLDYCSNIHNVTNPAVEFVKGNIANRELLELLIKKYEFDVVFHFAAQSHVCNSFNDPIVFTQENVLGTHVLIETFRQRAPHVEFIHFSTDEVYGENKTNAPFTECESVLNPTNPYSASKAAAEMIVNSYIESYKMNVKIIRCNNVYGPNQYPEKLIPKFIKLLRDGKKCTIHGLKSSQTKRAFIHVYDVVLATEAVFLRGTSGQVYNISSDYELSVMDVTRMIIRIVRNTTQYDDWIEYVEDRPFNDERYYICDTKLRQLGWKPEKTIKDLELFIGESS
jgi:dTDP-glucose 4,6-dehydratase/UDP-glucose 4,6-dehydratase